MTQGIPSGPDVREQCQDRLREQPPPHSANCPCLFLFSLGHQHDDAPLSLAPRSPHALHQADGALVGIKAHYEVDIANVQPLLSNACRHQGVVAPCAECLHHLQKQQLSVITEGLESIQLDCI